jgi:hypothetical protein
VEVSPWPFARGEIELVVEARRLSATFTSRAAMRAALARAPWVSLRTALRPGEQE